jgi:5-methylcytosine-specific restriction endonuclease McrA
MGNIEINLTSIDWMNSVESKTVYRNLIQIEKCLRCGYSEMKSSLHVHHLDADRENNNVSNLIVLCANCHYGLHRRSWDITELGFDVTPVKRHRKTPIDTLETSHDIKLMESKYTETIQNMEQAAKEKPLF